MKNWVVTKEIGGRKGAGYFEELYGGECFP